MGLSPVYERKINLNQVMLGLALSWMFYTAFQEFSSSSNFAAVNLLRARFHRFILLLIIIRDIRKLELRFSLFS